MIKVCPTCRMNNAADAKSCAGCGFGLSDVIAEDGSGGVTMFGSAPRPSGIKPLEKSAPAASSPYGGSGSRRAGGETKKNGNSAPAFEIGTIIYTSRPKKPWE